MISMEDIRKNVVARCDFADDAAKSDILDPESVHDNVIRALDIQTAPDWKGAGDGSKSHGHRLYISSVRHDHHDDSGLGPHGHAHGWAIDIGLIDNKEIGDNPTTVRYLTELISSNKYCNSVGTLNSVVDAHPELSRLADQHNTAFYGDNGTGPHIHMQASTIGETDPNLNKSKQEES